MPERRTAAKRAEHSKPTQLGVTSSVLTAGATDAIDAPGPTPERPDVAPWATAPAKRALDLVFSAVALALTVPLTIALALLIRLESRGPPLICQRRIGRRGAPFVMYKLRSMHMGAEQMLERHLANDVDARCAWRTHQKLQPDPRTTRVGRFLREYSLDELPQFWNVVRGHMALVGPRPILPPQRAMYGAALARYAHLRPGLTGLWQVSGRNRLSFAERIRCDEYYARCCSPWLDARILLRSVLVVLTRDGAS